MSKYNLNNIAEQHARFLKFTTKTCHQRQQTPPKSAILHTHHKMPKHNNKHHPKKMSH